MSILVSIFLNESKKLVRGPIVLTGVFAFLSFYLFVVFPSIKEEAEALEGAMPEAMITLFGIEALHTIEGFLASYTYEFFWVVFIGIYFAYLGGGLIASEIEDRKMDLTLSNPVSRESVILQKVGALWAPLLILNLGFLAIVFIGTFLIGESIEIIPVLMVHLLSIPYLLACAGIGLVFSVFMRDVSSAQAGAVGVVFILWLIEGIVQMDPDFEWMAYLSPVHYYDVADILIRGEYAFVGAGILTFLFIALLAVSIVWFIKRDI
ncbi:ABC transporter permease subunit [Methanonatronarchaeum thermophilum]|nr:ABC transporter permease subunit [Methanonatronarchaeum thermophilum]